MSAAELAYWFVALCVLFLLHRLIHTMMNDSWDSASLLVQVAAHAVLFAIISVAVLSLRSELFGDHTYFTLRADDWSCTAAHSETSTSYTQVGKVMVPLTSTHDVCDQYSRGARP